MSGSRKLSQANNHLGWSNKEKQFAEKKADLFAGFEDFTAKYQAEEEAKRLSMQTPTGPCTQKILADNSQYSQQHFNNISQSNSNLFFNAAPTPCDNIVLPPLKVVNSVAEKMNVKKTVTKPAAKDKRVRDALPVTRSELQWLNKSSKRPSEDVNVDAPAAKKPKIKR